MLYKYVCACVCVMCMYVCVRICVLYMCVSLYVYMCVSVLMALKTTEELHLSLHPSPFSARD